MKDRSKIISFTTACAMLVLMACIGLYYMQYDYDAAAYLKAFGYLVMTVSSIVALIFTANEEGKRDLAFASTAFSAIMLVSMVFSLIDVLGNYALSVSYIAIAFAAAFTLCYVAKLATGIKLFENVIVKIVLLLVGILVSVAMLVIPVGIVNLVFKAVAAIWTLIFVAGAVFAIINIAKNKETFINWSYLFYVLSYAAYTVQLIFNTYHFRKTALAIAMMAISFMLIALVCKEEVKELPKKNKR